MDEKLHDISMDTRAKHGLEFRHPRARGYCDVLSVNRQYFLKDLVPSRRANPIFSSLRLVPRARAWGTVNRHNIPKGLKAL